MMKLFRPEDHPEVGRDLDGLARRIKEKRPKIGTSGSGEITLRFDRCTFYVRKYRRREGWRLICRWRGDRRLKRLLADVDAVADVIGEILDEKGEA